MGVSLRPDSYLHVLKTDILCYTSRSRLMKAFLSYVVILRDRQFNIVTTHFTSVSHMCDLHISSVKRGFNEITLSFSSRTLSISECKIVKPLNYRCGDVTNTSLQPKKR